MKSVADELRERTRREVLAMTPDERLELAFALGDADLETYRLARGLSRDEARRELERRRQLGRRTSRCMLEIIG
jgi:hypothetical protein